MAMNCADSGLQIDIIFVESKEEKTKKTFHYLYKKHYKLLLLADELLKSGLTPSQVYWRTNICSDVLKMMHKKQLTL